MKKLCFLISILVLLINIRGAKSQAVTFEFRRVPITYQPKSSTNEGNKLFEDSLPDFAGKKISFEFGSQKLTPRQIREMEIQNSFLNNTYSISNSSSGEIENFAPTNVNLLNNKIDQMLVDIEIGTPAQKFSVLVDTGSSVLWVGSKDCFRCGGITNKFSSSKSSSYTPSYERIELNYGTGHAYGYDAIDKVTFSQLSKSAFFNFILATDIQFDYSDGILGLSYYNPTYGDKHSFMENLKTNGVISQNIISQKYTGSSSGLLIIGDYPSEVISRDGEKLGFCPLLPYYYVSSSQKISNPYWSCDLHGVFTGFKKEVNIIPLKESVIFDTGSNYNYVSSTFWDVLVNKIFSSYISQGTCWVDGSGSVQIIKCRNSQSLDIEAINFVFGQWSFFVRTSELFEQETSSTVFLNFMRFGTASQEFIFGEKFLKLFIAIHNKDTGLFQLYGENSYRLDKDYRPSDGTSTLIIILCVIGGLVALALLIFIISKLYKNYKARQANRALYYAQYQNEPINNNQNNYQNRQHLVSSNDF